MVAQLSAVEEEEEKIPRWRPGEQEEEEKILDVLRWRGRFHNHVQNKSTKNKKSLLGLVSYDNSQKIYFSGVDA